MPLSPEVNDGFYEHRGFPLRFLFGVIIIIPLVVFVLHGSFSQIPAPSHKYGPVLFMIYTVNTPNESTTNMSRDYDAGKNAYGREYRAWAGQNARHILADDLLGHYGANPQRYADAQQASGGMNYRMGSTATNGRDTRIDNGIIGSVFRNQGGGYDAYALTQASSRHSGMNSREATTKPPPWKFI